jgi:ligand-binding sensor domain-containing protein/DNA-binding response OmpR family regulator/signal transduction histidine kinase
MRSAYFYLLTISICFYTLFLRANDNRPQVSYGYRQLDNKSGLSNSAINTIFLDRDELLWIGTWDGLNRYDGSRFNVYNHSIENIKTSIGSNVVQSIAEDLNGNIWLNTIGGISRYQKNTGKFFRYFYKTTTTKKITENEYKLAISAQGEVFCYAADGMLSKYEPKSNKFNDFQKFESTEGIVKMQFEGNRLWYLTKNGSLKISMPTMGGLMKVRNIASGVNNFFVVGNKVIFSLNTDEHFEVGNDFKTRPINIAKRKIKTVATYQSKYIVAWENQGVNVYDADFKASDFLKSEAMKLNNLKATALSVSKDKVLWVGTDGNGVIQIYPKDDYFGILTKIAGTNVNKPIRAFSEYKGDLWVGTKGNGIFIFENFWQTHSALANPLKIDVNSGLDNNAVFVIKRGADQLTYIGTDGKGISIYDHKNKRSIKWRSVKGADKLPDFASVYAITQDADSSIWLGTSGYGLIHLKIKRNLDHSLSITNFKQFNSSTATDGLANDIIYALAKGTDGRLWIACRYGGLSVLEPRANTFKTFKAGYQGSLSHSDVLSLFYDSKNGLWIGTSYGLNYLSHVESLKKQPNFVKITMDQGGLLNNTIHAIQEDDDGNIWLSTNKGLAKLNPKSNNIINYLESDGLQSNEFSDGAVFKAANNYLLFGGIYGFNYFLPKKDVGNTNKPNLLISDLQIGGRDFQYNQYLIVKSNQSEPIHFELERKNNFFQFSLNAINYSNSAKTEFAYQLKGLERTWRYTGTDGKIAYYNLPPGNYEMLVKWSNGEGVWTNEVVALSMKVKPYLWLSYPAYFIYFILLIASGYAFHLYRKNKLEMKFKLERETLFRQKDEESHNQRINFFTNIAHEIQTPLTLILGSVEHFIQKQEVLTKPLDKNYFLSLMHQHTARLTYLVQQLLEFRKAEAGYLKRNDNYLDISQMLHALTQLFVPVAEKSEQQFIRNIQEDIIGFVDKDKYEKVLFNLLSNAFKHASANANVKFDVTYDDESQILETVVSNSGCALKEEDLESLFTEFHVKGESKLEKFSTGIGLAFTKGLVEVLDGTIDVVLKDDWIFFTVKFQLRRSVYEQGDELIASAPSYLFESILKPYQQTGVESVAENNKKALIEDLQGKKEHSVLIVEDDEALRFLLSNILKENYDVYEAENGVTAIQFLKNNMPDIIISDVMMPDMDGLTFCKLVKSAPATSQIPFIILSARDTEEHKTEGYETGADAYIPKPFHIDYLQVRIRKLLDYRKRMTNLIKDQHLNNQFVDTDLEQVDKEFLNALVKAVEENLAEPDLDAETLEKAMSVSKMQLYRKLKAIAGMTPSEFIKRIRLKHAAVLLQNSKLTVSEIFYLTGFNNKSYFFREFKKIYHLAPNDYRAKTTIGSASLEDS